ncbi:UDP-glycosyltransferase 73D1-like [Aegilops tauschii subsp. strangulata]|uniref:Glycosyltransferase n=1 Tax=Aegilops tauschii subsp. strangulata TaxID=200361 RepID=A0A453CH63_AEGTS|nr:UDP-glycosyltransferase 73D1 [Aegilops tauschii subsp. strangulata]XP_045089124.1 UDP-glycosyltransferase 73D1 [Aegilops tauschii subsp. strangulata]
MEATLSAKPHFVVIPWPTTSHIIPIVDIGCLLALHGAAVTILTTPASAQLVQSRVDRVGAQGDSAGIEVTVIPYPSVEAGLPEGCERLDHVPAPDMVPCFFDATTRFGDAVATHCRLMASPRRPSCIIAGMCNTWASGIARELGVPCYIFQGFSAFALLCCEYLHTHKPHEAVASLDELFDVPVLPPFECKFARRQLPLQFLPSCSIGEESLQELREFELAVDGIVVNSFEELEHDSAARLAAATGKTVLAVGPVSLCHAPALDVSDDATRCMAWLDAKKAKSVLYVSFGSAGRMPPAQLMDLGMALVSCPWPVLWVIKGADSLPDDAKKWLQENTDADGVADSQCLAVRGWAPQVPILSHPAVAGFMTHCGWGSTLESVAAGVPMAAWPFTAEQFLNEKLIVNVLGIGVSVGVTKPTEGVLTGGSGGAKAEVGMEQVKTALEKLMDGGAEGEDRIRKVQELKAKAKAALENGGSSCMNLDKLVQSVV